jgi:hypothetical protein
MAFFFWIGMPAIFLGIFSASADPEPTTQKAIDRRPRDRVM